jgi:hypothetical protein
MSADTVITVLAAPACVIYLILTRRSVRMMRAGDEEWRQQWRQLDPARRKSIRKRIKRGEAVLDREDAELAVRAVAQIDYVREAMAPVTRASMFLVLAFLIVGVVSGSTILIVIGAFGLGSSAVFDLLSCRQRRRYQKSTVATRRVHDVDNPLPD